MELKEIKGRDTLSLCECVYRYVCFYYKHQNSYQKPEKCRADINHKHVVAGNMNIMQKGNELYLIMLRLNKIVHHISILWLYQTKIVSLQDHSDFGETTVLISI